MLSRSRTNSYEIPSLKDVDKSATQSKTEEFSSSAKDIDKINSTLSNQM